MAFYKFTIEYALNENIKNKNLRNRELNSDLLRDRQG